MDKQQAIRLVSDTLTQDFDRKRFQDLTVNLFKRPNLDKAMRWNHIYVKNAFKPGIERYERLFTFEDSKKNKIDVLVVYLQKESSLNRARTFQRNFIADYLIRGHGSNKDAVVAAFVPAEVGGDWRFSFIKLETALERKESGEVGTRTDLTPAKRFSYLVGANERCHTAQKQLIPLLTNLDGNPTLDDLENSFSVEKVSREFFEQYKELFFDVQEALEKTVAHNPQIKKDFAEKDVNTIDFSKKLLGQIVFLYFLQKKGWFGVERNKEWGTGPKNFLRTLFERKDSIAGKGANFFNDVLEPLFYEALAQERDSDYYSRFDCRIPFLNGGLFDPLNGYDWVHADINIPNTLFSNRDRASDDSSGTGILDVFDRYNFTVNEAEPLESEVAVDPEMLGKVFERLLEVDERKSKGSFYTPREIVHHMCQQSLVEYLYRRINTVAGNQELVPKADIEALISTGRQAADFESARLGGTKITHIVFPKSIENQAKGLDDLLASIRVCDPAIGSGAFPVGMMTEIVHARISLNSYLGDGPQRAPYHFKRQAIQECLFGVDIDPGAVEIAKLRLWLALIVDEESSSEIRPLPNLDFKIMQGNSLREDFDGVVLFDEALINNKTVEEEAQEVEAKIKARQREYIELHQSGRLDKLAQGRLEEELKRLQAAQKKEKNKTPPDGLSRDFFEDYNRASKKLEELRAAHAAYFNSSRRKEKQVLRTQLDHLEWEFVEAHLREKGNASALAEVKRLRSKMVKPFFIWKLHFYEVFKDRGGFDIVIGNPPYIKEYTNRAAFDGLRESPYYMGKMDIWYFFACKGLDLVRPESGLLTFIAQNNWVTSAGAKAMREKIRNEGTIAHLIDFGPLMVFESAAIQTMILICARNSAGMGYPFDFRRIVGAAPEQYEITNILHKRQSASVEILNPIFDRSRLEGKPFVFAQGATEEILQKIEAAGRFRLDPKTEIAQGIVAPQDSVNKKGAEKLKGEAKVGEGIFVLSDKEERGLRLNQDEQCLLRPYFTTDELHKYVGIRKNKYWVIYTGSTHQSESAMKRYPKIREHLHRFRKIITSSNAPYGLHRQREEFYFKKDTIASLRKCEQPTFTYVDFDCFVSQTFNLIKSKRINMKFLVGMLNSKIIAFYLRHRGKMQGRMFQVDNEPLAALPLLNSDDPIAGEVEKLVEQILSRKRQSLDSDTSKEERRIDEALAQSYGLTAADLSSIRTTPGV